MLSFNFESDFFLFFSVLRERKQAIVKLFDLVGLKPQAGANVKGKSAEFNVTEEVSKKSAKRPVKKIKEIVGDDEEIEVEDTEDLSRNDIEAIYTRCYPFSFDYVLL
jgi:DNA repair protein RAD5